MSQASSWRATRAQHKTLRSTGDSKHRCSAAVLSEDSLRRGPHARGLSDGGPACRVGSQRDALAGDIFDERCFAPHGIVQNPLCDNARRDVDAELEVHVEGNVDCAIFERCAFALWLDDDKSVD